VRSEPLPRRADGRGPGRRSVADRRVLCPPRRAIESPVRTNPVSVSGTPGGRRPPGGRRLLHRVLRGGRVSRRQRSRCPMSDTGRREYTTPHDRYYNYCWWGYQPVAPTEHKFRPVSLLFHAFEVAGVDGCACEVVEVLRNALGPFRTVWGTKW